MMNRTSPANLPKKRPEADPLFFRRYPGKGDVPVSGVSFTYSAKGVDHGPGNAQRLLRCRSSVTRVEIAFEVTPQGPARLKKELCRLPKTFVRLVCPVRQFMARV